MSVGAVIDVRRWHELVRGDPEGTFHELIRRCPPIAYRLAHATRVSPVRIIRDYSYDSARFYGPGYLLAGDAACFIDPVFSTGVHLACLAAYLGGRAATKIVRGEAPEADALAAYDASYRSAFDRYLRFPTFLRPQRRRGLVLAGPPHPPSRARRHGGAHRVRAAHLRRGDCSLADSSRASRSARRGDLARRPSMRGWRSAPADDPPVLDDG
jgi:flavin-dependent dehydrogenase